MAEYLIQDTTLAAIAEAVREKEGSSDAIRVSELAGRIAAISTGVEVQTASGTITTSNGSGSVNIGFKPDAVEIVIKSGTPYYTMAAVFTGVDNTKSTGCRPSGLSYTFLSGSITRTDTGFNISSLTGINNSGNTVSTNGTYDFIAVKYT